MKGLFAIFLVLSLLLISSCINNQSTSEKEIETSESASVVPIDIENIIEKVKGKPYAFAPEIDSVTCQVSGGCDCCYSDFVFINDSAFLQIDYCMNDKLFLKGKFKYKDKKIKLYYDSIGVDKQYNPEKEIDTTGTVMVEYLYIRHSMKKGWQPILTPFLCNNTLAFSSELGFGSIETSTTLDTIVKWFNADSIRTKF